jgi:hypothetical protein
MRVTPSVNVDDLIALSTDEPMLASINEDMLTSTTVPEAAPAAYSAGATYALDDQVSVATGTARDVYVSLEAGNIGNTPASSPTKWTLLGRTYVEWSAGTYGLGDVVLVAASHLEYVSLEASNSAALTDSTKWFVRPSNAWRMFDLKRNTKTVSPSPLSVVITSGRRVNTIGLTGLQADRAIINVTRDDVTIYSQTITLSRRRTTTWSGYFFGTFGFKSAEARFDLPLYSDGVISLTLERASGDVSCGAALIGRSVYLGKTLHNTQNDAENFSTIEHDEFGDSTMVRRRMVPMIKANVECAKANLPAVLDVRSQLNAIPALWSGIDDADSGYFEPLLSIGAHTRFIATLDKPESASLDLEIKEV